MKSARLLLASACFMALFAERAAAQALPTPPGVRPEIVAEDMRFNGAPMQIVQFVSDDAAKTADFYRRYFDRRADDGLYVENVVAERRTMGATLGVRHISVEFIPMGEKTALIYVSSLEHQRLQPPEKLARDLPHAPEGEILQVMDSRDGPKRNRYVVANNRRSVENNAMYLRERFLAGGWRRDHDETITPGLRRQLLFSKAARRLRVDIKRIDRDTCMVIYNEIEG
jgi:hypothetical protein